MRECHVVNCVGYDKLMFISEMPPGVNPIAVDKYIYISKFRTFIGVTVRKLVASTIRDRTEQHSIDSAANNTWMQV